MWLKNQHDQKLQHGAWSRGKARCMMKTGSLRLLQLRCQPVSMLAQWRCLQLNPSSYGDLLGVSTGLAFEPGLQTLAGLQRALQSPRSVPGRQVSISTGHKAHSPAFGEIIG